MAVESPGFSAKTRLPAIRHTLHRLWKSPNAKAITPFMQTAGGGRPPSSETREQMQHYLDLTLDLMERTSGSIHGIHKTFASPGLPDFFGAGAEPAQRLAIAGLKNWVDYGIRNYGNHPERQRAYFSLQSADSRGVFQRERHGTLLVDHERRARPLPARPVGRQRAAGTVRHRPRPGPAELSLRPLPYYDPTGIRLPDVLDDANGVSRDRSLPRGAGAHRRSPALEPADVRRQLQPDAAPGDRVLRRQPHRGTDPCASIRGCSGLSSPCIRSRSKTPATPKRTRACAIAWRCCRARLLDPAHGYRDACLGEFVLRFQEVLAQGDSSSAEMASLALAYVARSRRQSDQLASVYFADTEISYRDDNRHLWRFHEASDDEEMFDDRRPPAAVVEPDRLPPRHYPEWDYQSQSYRPDWVSLYESLHPAGNAARIDQLLEKHATLAGRLKRLLDLLKPQDRVRIRYQEDGSELDLDIAIRSLIDFKSSVHPDPRINLSHRTNGRNLAVLLLLDLSASLNDKVRVGGGEQTVLELSQEAVSLLAWSIEQLGDSFAVAGFRSDTRHDVRYLHLKGYSECWGDAVKGRLAAMQAGYSTRIGAAMRHAAHYLAAQPAEKKLMLILTDGQPADVDVHDDRLLIEDAHKAVGELDRRGIFSYCISLDRHADAYVSDIFGRRYSVIDHIERLPEKLPELFMVLTK
jgi:nitric oxide reductase NorD protein